VGDPGWSSGSGYSYDWRKQEARLNEFPQFTTTIDGANVHFLHVRSQGPKALPLIITHGWPGSIVEFLNIIRPLTDPAAHGARPSDAFHLVIPSIPGYGLSGPTREVGWTTARVARAWAELMSRLGYERYGARRTATGARSSPGARPCRSRTRRRRPRERRHVRVLAVRARGPGRAGHPHGWGEARLERLSKSTAGPGNGYFEIQATRPQTLAYGLTDSPVGQLAWIVERFKEWTHSADIPEDAVDRDQMLTNVMLYWLTGTAAASARLYYENMHSVSWSQQPSTTPTGVAVFAEAYAIRRYAERGNNIVHWSEFDRGGHFAAMEVPDLLMGDRRKSFRALR